LTSDREVVAIAVANNGLALEYAADDLKSDREIVLAAIQSDFSALEFATDEFKSGFKSDRDLIDFILLRNREELELVMAQLDFLSESDRV